MLHTMNGSWVSCMPNAKWWGMSQPRVYVIYIAKVSLPALQALQIHTWIDNEWCLRPKCMIETSNWSKSWSYCLTIQVSKHRFCGRLRKGASTTVSLLRFSSICLFIDPLLRLSGKPASKLAGIDNSKLKIEGQEVFNKSSTEPSRCTFKPHTFSRFFPHCAGQKRFFSSESSGSRMLTRSK